RRLHEAASARARGRAAAGTGGHVANCRRRIAGSRLQRPRAASDRGARVSADRTRLGPRRRARAPAADRKRRHLRRVSHRARHRAARGRAHGADRVSTASAAAAVVQLVGGVALAPLLPGLVQHWKARLQGRRGPTPLQPYRELRRLWRKSAVDPEGAGSIYRIAPAVVAAALIGVVLVVPVAEAAPTLGLGHDALVLLGLLALARFAAAAGAWDVSNGFSLMG